ncbi:alpha/beta fold hydrolase [Candidatus Bipolaricaulota bacterium]
MMGWIVAGFLVVLLGVLLTWWMIPRTPKFRTRMGQIVPGSIASLETIRLGGMGQSILIRGRDTSKPVLLFLHGGPGMPAMFLAHKFQNALETEFVVVHWDRLGAGKSFDPQLSPERMSVSQVMSDSLQLVDYLRGRFSQRKIYLVGHSWGTCLGLLLIDRNPGMFHAYVGIGQLTGCGHDSVDIAEIQDRFIREAASAAGQDQAIAELEAKGAAVREKWLIKFGGEIHRAESFWPLLKAGLTAPEYSLRDFLKVPQGAQFSQAHMTYDELDDQPLIERITSVRTPVYFFTGRYDFTDPFELTERYFEKLSAPFKRLIWFENSAHFCFYEEPEAFARKMLEVVEGTPQML